MNKKAYFKLFCLDKKAGFIDFVSKFRNPVSDKIGEGLSSHLGQDVAHQLFTSDEQDKEDARRYLFPRAGAVTGFDISGFVPKSLKNRLSPGVWHLSRDPKKEIFVDQRGAYSVPERLGGVWYPHKSQPSSFKRSLFRREEKERQRQALPPFKRLWKDLKQGIHLLTTDYE